MDSDHHSFLSDGSNLIPSDVVRIARSLSDEGNGAPVERVGMSPGAAAAVERSRAVVDGIVARGEVVYGITTGFGAFKDKVIHAEDLAQLQVNLILSQCVG